MTIRSLVAAFAAKAAQVRTNHPASNPAKMRLGIIRGFPIGPRPIKIRAAGA
jgi:hypothetical protein